MPHYQKMYTILFNAMTDALTTMERGEYQLAKDILICAQRRTEAIYISVEENRNGNI